MALFLWCIVKLFVYFTIITILQNATISNPSIIQNGVIMSFYILVAVACVGVLILRYVLRKKAYELKQKLYNEISVTQTPLTAHELGDKFNAGDGMVYSLLDELVEEKRIAITVTQKVIAGRRVRIRHYHSMIGAFVQAGIACFSFFLSPMKYLGDFFICKYIHFPYSGCSQ